MACMHYVCIKIWLKYDKPGCCYLTKTLNKFKQKKNRIKKDRWTLQLSFLLSLFCVFINYFYVCTRRHLFLLFLFFFVFWFLFGSKGWETLSTGSFYFFVRDNNNKREDRCPATGHGQSSIHVNATSCTWLLLFIKLHCCCLKIKLIERAF